MQFHSNALLFSAVTATVILQTTDNAKDNGRTLTDIDISVRERVEQRSTTKRKDHKATTPLPAGSRKQQARSATMSELTNNDYNPSASGGAVKGGFNFDNVHRNTMIEKMLSASKDGSNAKLPAAKKTGTTISGMVFDGGVVLGADTRSTNGDEVAEKNCEKIHYLAPNIYCCGAGTAADTEKTTQLISSQLDLLRMETHSQSRVVTSCTMLRRLLFRYQGYIGAALVLGGCDVDGPHLFQIYPHGSTGKLPYVTMGSGSLAAMAVYESSWREAMNEADAVELVQRTILAGIFNDLGSGSNCDICVIRTDGTTDMRRNVLKPNPVEPLRNAITRSGRLTMPPGVTPILETSFIPHPAAPAEESTVTEMEVES